MVDVCGWYDWVGFDLCVLFCVGLFAGLFVCLCLFELIVLFGTLCGVVVYVCLFC